MPKQIINPEYDFGDQVYLRTDPEQLPRLVASYAINPNGWLYGLIHSDGHTTYHHEFEISGDYDIVTATSN